MYEQFEHTADLGLRIVADSPEAIFAEAGLGFLDILIDDGPTTVRPTMAETISLSADSYEDLLIDWLGELLYRFETSGMLFSRFAVTLDRFRLDATACGERYDTARHRPGDPVKAVTYHRLKFEQHPDGRWLAEVILDL
jgi:protein archease